MKEGHNRRQLGVAKAKKPFLQRRTTGWTSTQRFLSPSVAYFPRLVNICILDLFRVRFLRENTLHRVSPIFFLNHFKFLDFLECHLVFGDFEELATRGALAIVEQSLR